LILTLPIVNLSENKCVFPGTGVHIDLSNSPPSRAFITDVRNNTRQRRASFAFACFGIQKGDSFKRCSEFGVYCKVSAGSKSQIIMEGLWLGMIVGDPKNLGKQYEFVEVKKLDDDIDLPVPKDYVRELRASLNMFINKYDQSKNSRMIWDIARQLNGSTLTYKELNDMIWKAISLIPGLGLEWILIFLESDLERRMDLCSKRFRDLAERSPKPDKEDGDPVARLGQELEPFPELMKYFKRFLEIKVSLNEEAQKTIVDDFDKLKSHHSGGEEYSKFLGHLTFLLALPWASETSPKISIAKVAEILDQDHACLNFVKDNICDYVAPKILNPQGRADILCFVGPPGVGKTSLGASIAKALDKKFVRMSVGGLRDEAEIRGHRVTYVGSTPGRVLRLLKQCGTKNLVFMIDEIDKMEKSSQGDPGSALLEVLDPEQNHSFVDLYAGTGFDLSQILFICTANVEQYIPVALRDRMDIIRFPGYTEWEKIKIAKEFLISKNLNETGLENNMKVSWSDDAILKLINGYTREAGVRNLNRRMKEICRKLAGIYLEKETKEFDITPDSVELLLGPPKYVLQEARPTGIGITIGLAWTPHGGEILRVESRFFPRIREADNLLQTGLQQKVMQEANRAALTNLAKFVDQEEFRKKLQSHLIHLHIPEGAIPKDGPSAGITAFCAIYSLFRGLKVRPLVAMTGEINLEGGVLPVGGIKEKIIAARNAGINEVILPQTNERNLLEVPEDIKNKMKFHLVSSIDEVIGIAFEKNPA